jgi:hypothetical protein
MCCRYVKSILERSNDGNEGEHGPTGLEQQSHYALKLSATEAEHKEAFLVYYKKMSLNRLFLFDCTVVPHAAVLLFSGGSLAWQKNKDRVTLGGWVDMRITELHCVLYRRLQREIDSLMRVKVEDPGRDISDRQHMLSHIVQLLMG